MKKIAVIVAALLLSLAATITPQEEYIRKYSSIAVSEMSRTGVPASITLAQGILESNSGQSVLSSKGHNHFGIKCHQDWKGKTMKHDDDRKNECFRVYDNDEQSFRDHSDFLRYWDRYKGLFELDPKDYKGWAKGLKAAGYATSPTYADNLIGIIERYRLYEYDGGVPQEALPETPAQMEKPVVSVRYSSDTFRFSLHRTVYDINGVPFVYAIEGDTFESIASLYDLFPKEILRFNDLDASRPLEVGERVYIHAKKRRSARGVDKHVFTEGETVWDIAQRYGVRMSSIVKRNKLAADYVPQEGDTIKLR